VAAAVRDRKRLSSSRLIVDNKGVEDVASRAEWNSGSARTRRRALRRYSRSPSSRPPAPGGDLTRMESNLIIPSQCGDPDPALGERIVCVPAC